MKPRLSCMIAPICEATRPSSGVIWRNCAVWATRRHGSTRAIVRAALRTLTSLGKAASLPVIDSGRGWVRRRCAVRWARAPVLPGASSVPLCRLADMFVDREDNCFRYRRLVMTRTGLGFVALLLILRTPLASAQAHSATFVVTSGTDTVAV